MYKVAVQAIGDISTVADIFAIAPAAELAEELGENQDTVRKWPGARRIPVEHWRGVRAALAKRGRELTLEQLLDMHAPRKRRRSRAACGAHRGGRRTA